MPKLHINEDNQSFYAQASEDQISPEGVDSVVDAAAAFPVTSIAFCINVQRALFSSQVWETFYGDYDPALGEEQPALWRKHGARNLWLLEQRGIDHHARWLARCRHHGIEGWISMRMNDCHGLKEFALGDSSAEKAHHWTRHWASTFWQQHPEYRRAPYRMERSWEGAFDFSHEEVRQHHLNLVEEALGRWDMHGFELDWMRWGMYFGPGKEQAGLPILTQFMRDTRRLAEASAQRVGHPVKIAVRVPAEPAACLALGMDVPQWAEEGLIDRVILSGFLGGANFDYPIALWRRLLGPQVEIIVNVEPVVHPHPASPHISAISFTYGAAASALERGVDGLHLFNHCPSKLIQNNKNTPYLEKIYSTLGSEDALQTKPRRHPVTYPQIFAPGETPRSILPIPLTVPRLGAAFGRMEGNITLRFPSGTIPAGSQVFAQLGFSEDTPPLDSPTLRVNQVVCQPVEAFPTPYDVPPEDPMRTPDHGAATPESKQILRYTLPIEACQNGMNIVEFEAPQVPGSLVWADLLIIPPEN